MIAARMITGRVHLFPEPGGNSLCSAEGTRNPLKAPTAEYLGFIPLQEALKDIDLCSTCRREYERLNRPPMSPVTDTPSSQSIQPHEPPAPKPAKKPGRRN